MRRYIQEDRTFYDHRCENLKSYVMLSEFSIRVCIKYSWRTFFVCLLRLRLRNSPITASPWFTRLIRSQGFRVGLKPCKASNAYMRYVFLT
jgi:hypothetical protein